MRWLVSPVTSDSLALLAPPVQLVTLARPVIHVQLDILAELARLAIVGTILTHRNVSLAQPSTPIAYSALMPIPVLHALSASQELLARFAPLDMGEIALSAPQDMKAQAVPPVLLDTTQLRQPALHARPSAPTA